MNIVKKIKDIVALPSRLDGIESRLEGLSADFAGFCNRIEREYSDTDGVKGIVSDMLSDYTPDLDYSYIAYDVAYELDYDDIADRVVDRMDDVVSDSDFSDLRDRVCAIEEKSDSDIPGKVEEYEKRVNEIRGSLMKYLEFAKRLADVYVDFAKNA